MSGAISHVTFDLIVSGVDTVLPLAEAYAKASVGKWDDSLVAFVKTIRGSEVLMKWIHTLVCDHPEIVTKSGAARDGAIEAALSGPSGDTLKTILAALGIAYDTVKPYLPSVIRLLLTAIGLRG